MKPRFLVGLIVAALALLAAGCDPFRGPLPEEPAPSPYFIQHLEGNEASPLTLDLDPAVRDVYFTFVNPNLSDVSGSVTVNGSVAGPEPAMAAVAAARRELPSQAARERAPTPAFITEFNQNPFCSRGRGALSLRRLERPPTAPLFDTEGSPAGGTFYNMDLSPVPATCRKVVTGVGVSGGTRTLNIWVANNCWELGGSKSKLVYQFMVDALALNFLKIGAFNDIYDWVTGMLGPEWGLHGYSDLITPNNEITIFLCDIDNDNAPGGYVGYYWSKDNFVKGNNPAYLDYYSSERVMFTVDAVSFAAGNDLDPLNWQITDYWPEEILSTLAHEFQHMIHFYQRGVLSDAIADRDTWINEMASQVVEDLVADKMAVIGPRGVDTASYPDGSAGAAANTEGRLPLFNYFNDISLSDWGGTDVLASYSVTYAFGAWLARNYGGAMLLNRLMHCTSTGPASIEYIVGQATGATEHFSRIMQRWSVAQLLSNVTDAPGGCQYNRSGFFPSSVGGNTYQLGSINLYNYDYESPPGTLVQSGPYLSTGSPVGTFQHLSTSAALHEAALAATGAHDWTLHMPAGMVASVLVRP